MQKSWKLHRPHVQYYWSWCLSRDDAHDPRCVHIVEEMSSYLQLELYRWSLGQGMYVKKQTTHTAMLSWRRTTIEPARENLGCFFKVCCVSPLSSMTLILDEGESPFNDHLLSGVGTNRGWPFLSLVKTFETDHWWARHSATRVFGAATNGSRRNGMPAL